MTDEGLYERALALSNQRRYRDARRLLDEAAEVEHDPERAARIAGTRAYVLTQLGEPSAGERICREALAMPRLSDHTRGVLAGQLASLLSHQGRMEDALEAFDLAITQLVDDPLAQANLRMNRSVLYMQRSELDAAAADLELAISAFRDVGQPVEVAEAQHNLGYVRLLRGELVEAMSQMASARPQIAAVSVANAAIGDVDRAEVLREAGLVRDAEQLLASASDAFGRERMPQARAEADLQRARSLLRHDPARARTVAGAAARRFEGLGATTWRWRADAVRLRAAFAAHAAGRGRRPPTAEVERAIRGLSRRGLRNDAAALRLARELSRIRAGEPSRSTAPPDEASSIEVRMLTHEVRASRTARSHDHRGTLRHAAAGLDELAEWQAAFGAIDLQNSAAMHGSALMQLGLDAAILTGDVATIFDWSERARHLSQQVVALRPPPDPQLAADLAELRLLRTESPDGDWLRSGRAREIADRVRRRQWSASAVHHVDVRVGLADVQQQLDADTAVLAYVYGSTGVRCLLVTAEDAEVFELPAARELPQLMAGLRADFDMSASAPPGPMREVVRRSLDRRLAQLSAVLVEAPLARTGATRIAITAPGLLAGLAWTLLPGLHGRLTTLAPSLSRWIASRRLHPATRVQFAAGPRVARADEEVRAAAAAWPDATVLTGDAATVDAVTAAAAACDVLHIAAHGRHAADNALFSGLELADGALFGHDIERMQRVPDIVVLSACEVGRSAVRWGEESLGMARTWLHAGARCVIAAPVVVGDDDACDLLAALHAGLAAGESPAAALAHASAATGITAPFQCHGAGF